MCCSGSIESHAIPSPLDDVMAIRVMGLEIRVPSIVFRNSPLADILLT
jgi:hypothetical protein